MKNDAFDHVVDILGCTYTSVAQEARSSRSSLVNSLLTQRQLPVEGWSALEIKQLLLELAAVDANCQQGQASVGEREGRVYSHLVKDRHFHFAHGIGRSGDIFALQPKAVGSSLVYRLTCYLALHAIKICGIQSASRCLPLPLATGMSLSLCLSALRSQRPGATIVIVSRIDQKSCIKAVAHAGLNLCVVDQRVESDGAIVTDVKRIEELINDKRDEVLCVMSTTSSFAPRQPDLLPQLSELCKRTGVAHLINNAYGLQCSKCCSLVEEACRVGRVDFVVSSSDKNFMTPVGGALVYGPDPKLIARVSASYPGRASMSPILDLFITLLEMGQDGLQKLLQERKALFSWFKEELSENCEKLGLRLLPSPHNKISIAVDLSGLAKGGVQEAAQAATFLGSQLFIRRCSGLRVVVPTDKITEISGHSFRSFGSHCVYPVTYCSVACAIGAEEEQLSLFLARFVQLVTHAKNSIKGPIQNIEIEEQKQIADSSKTSPAILPADNSETESKSQSL